MATDVTRLLCPLWWNIRNIIGCIVTNSPIRRQDTTNSKICGGKYEINCCNSPKFPNRSNDVCQYLLYLLRFAVFITFPIISFSPHLVKVWLFSYLLGEMHFTQ